MKGDDSDNLEFFVEGIVICLDVSPGMRIKCCSDDPRTPLQIAIECIQWILQRRIFSESKDEIGMVIFGSETNNPLFKGNQYRNVSIFRKLEVVDWDFDIAHKRERSVCAYR
uniref:Ku70/Ku80 N-terminal alpha/beta domain-containing protein n=1 Tax=Romanomermis culicivorax TaxID=13658 RepID=A0A915IQT4_ROMCU